MSTADLPICVAALYHFTRFEDRDAVRAALVKACTDADIKGTLLVAREGLNGTIAGSDEGIGAILAFIGTLPGCADFDHKLSRAATMPFKRMKVRLKAEIVTMGQPDIDPLETVGHYVAPEDWNALIADPDTIVIDTRNDYEVALGTFRGAVDPETRSFREFPDWFRNHRDALLDGKKKVAMFCTGGIRCEKSTAFLKAEGIDDVYHLKGGILKYLETVPQARSMWDGECFVFDERVSVGHGLALGQAQLCAACNKPVSADDRASPLFEDGVSCPACHGARTEAQRARYRARRASGKAATERP